MPTQKTGYTDTHAAAGLDTKFPSIDTWANQFRAYEILVDDPEFTRRTSSTRCWMTW